METRQWINQRQPQMLQSATILLYIRAAFGLLSLGGGGGGLLFLLTLAGAPAGFGIANDKKWGYYLAIGVAIVPLALSLGVVFGVFGKADFTNSIISLLFDVLLVGLLLHPMSKDYARLWFK